MDALSCHWNSIASQFPLTAAPIGYRCFSGNVPCWRWSGLISFTEALMKDIRILRFTLALAALSAAVAGGCSRQAAPDTTARPSGTNQVRVEQGGMASTPASARETATAFIKFGTNVESDGMTLV